MPQEERLSQFSGTSWPAWKQHGLLAIVLYVKIRTYMAVFQVLLIECRLIFTALKIYQNSTRKALLMKVCLKDTYSSRWFKNSNNNNNSTRSLFKSLFFSLNIILSKRIHGEIFFLVSLSEMIKNVNVYWVLPRTHHFSKCFMCINPFNLWNASVSRYRNYLLQMRILKHQKVK